jgi:hypothetical protein
MPDITEALFKYCRPGLSFELFTNRIEISTGAIARKRETILLHNITHLNLDDNSRLQILLHDGRFQEYSLGLRGAEARDALAAALP